MVTLTGVYLQHQFNDSAITPTEAEYVLDGAINLLNSYGAGITELAGDPKTGEYTSAQTGAIMAVAMQIYRENWKHADGESAQIGALGQTFSTSNQLLSFARQLAYQLKGRSLERV